MATTNMQATYEKALERAKADGIVIVGRGHRLADGVCVVYTSSATGEACHAVAIHPDHMSCTCQAGQRGHYCKHRAAVRADLIEKAIAAAARLERKPAAPVAPRRVECRGVNDTRPITIWAA